MANISKINFTSNQYYSNNIKKTRNSNSQNKRCAQFYTIDSRFDDEFIRRTDLKSRKKQKSNHLVPKSLMILAASLGISTVAPKAIAFISGNNEAAVISAEGAQMTDLDYILEPEMSQMSQEDYCEFIKYAMSEQDSNVNIEDEPVAAVNAPEDNGYALEAEKLLNDILEKDEFSSEHLENLKKSFNYELSEIEILSNLVYLCDSEQWGNNCIDPLTFYAQLCQESDCKSDALGDYSKSKDEYLALGFGQFHKCAVDEVNKQIEAGTYGDYCYNQGEEYTLEDRKDPEKALEMMILLLRYDASKTDSTEAMLAMYNRGHKGGINTMDGKEYVRKVYGRIGKEY